VRDGRAIQFERLRRRRRHYEPRGIPTASTEEITTGGAPTDLDGALMLSVVTTGGTGSAEQIAITDGSVLDFKKIVELAEIAAAGDYLSFSNLTNIRSSNGRDVTKIELTKEEHFVMFRWTGPGGKWEIMRSHRGVTIEVG